MRERQREGIAKAKHDGDVNGVCRLKQEGVRPSAIALRLGIGRASVYWALGSRDVRVRRETYACMAAQNSDRQGTPSTSAWCSIIPVKPQRKPNLIYATG